MSHLWPLMDISVLGLAKRPKVERRRRQGEYGRYNVRD